MKDPRTKRRRVSAEAESVDEEGDTQMHDTPRQPTKQTTAQTPTRSSGRQRKPVQRFEASVQDGYYDEDDDEDDDEDYDERAEKSRRTGVLVTRAGRRAESEEAEEDA